MLCSIQMLARTRAKGAGPRAQGGCCPAEVGVCFPQCLGFTPLIVQKCSSPGHTSSPLTCLTWPFSSHFAKVLTVSLEGRGLPQGVTFIH